METLDGRTIRDCFGNMSAISKMNILEDYLSSAAGESTREGYTIYISTRSGILVLTGPPITAVEFNLEDDFPVARPCVPDINLRQLRCAETLMHKIIRRNSLKASRKNLLTDSTYAFLQGLEVRCQGRLAKHLGIIRSKIIGDDLFRRISSFGEKHFQIAFWASRYPAFRDLLGSNRGLAFALASTSDPLSSDTVPAFRHMLSLKQRDLAISLNFPADCWRILRKICPHALTVRTILALRTNLGNPEIFECARHLKSIGVDSIEILSNSRLFRNVSPRFMQRVTEDESHRQTPRIAPQLRTALRLKEHGGKLMLQKPFSSLAKLNDWFNDHCAHINIDKIETIAYFKFYPPIPDEVGAIEGIRSGQELIEESLCQNNCVADMDYCQELMSGDVSLYRCMGWGLDRGTIQLNRIDYDDRSIWVATEIRGQRNRDVSCRTVEAIAIWLGQRQEIENHWSLVPRSCERGAQLWLIPEISMSLG